MLAVLLAAVAVAAPPSPALASGLGADVYLSAAQGSEHLATGECGAEDTGCRALRADDLQGGTVVVRTGTPVAVYVGAGHAHEDLAAAMYSGTGWGGRAGVRVDFGAAGRSAPLLTGFAWAEAATAHTASDDGSCAARWRADIGGAAVFGRLDDGVRVWAGAEATPWRADRATVVDGTFELPLQGRLPLAGVTGVAFVSDPVGGPWNDAGRLAAGLSARIGGASGIEGFFAVAL